MCKATYDNSFCMDSDCRHYYEDICTLAIGESMMKIHPDCLIEYKRASELYPQFKKGISDWYKEK